MGTFADSLFTALMSWVRALVNGLWALFSSEDTTLLEFLGKNWLAIAVIIIAAGLVIDWVIWLLRWQPYHLWAQRARRLLRMEEPQEAHEEEAPRRARAAQMPPRKAAYAQENELQQTMAVAPVAAQMEAEDEQAVLTHASHVPDEYAYPGMRYGTTASEPMGSTQRFGAVTQEGPGAAEVEKRREEIQAWQLQMQEEARARARAEQERLAQQAREAEQARLAQQAYEDEQARLAQEAREAEQARLAQAEYERELAEYERQKAQYERDLAEYERQKAQYEAYLAQEAASQEQAEEIAPQAGGTRRRRGAQQPATGYSDYVTGEDVAELPNAPQWPQMQAAQHAPEEEHRKHGLLDRMAKMIEPEDEQLISRTKLPPRVDMKDAYKPAAAPRKPGKRSGNG